MKKDAQKQFRGALILSVLLHFIIVGSFYFKLPSAFEKLPEEKEILTFEIVQVKEVSNIKTRGKRHSRKISNKLTFTISQIQ